MDLLYWQLIFIVSLFLLAVCGSFWPLIALKWKLKQKEGTVAEDFKDSKTISLGNNFSCGVFFALCFLHLIPHSVEKWNDIYERENNATNITEEAQHHKHLTILAPFLILFSFTIMLFFEKNEVLCKQKPAENLPIIILTRVSSKFINVTKSKTNVETYTFQSI